MSDRILLWLLLPEPLGYWEMNGCELQWGIQDLGVTGCKGREQHKQVSLKRHSSIIFESFFFYFT